MKKKVIAGMLALAFASAGLWFLTRSKPDDSVLILYGNVDIRQVSLAFENSERISEVRVEEGDKVKAGQVLAVLDTRTLHLQAAQAEAAINVQKQVLLRLQNGVRPEERLQAKARLEAALADVSLAEQDLKRLQGIARDTGGKAISHQDLDRAAARRRVVQAQAQDQAEALRLAQLGPRAEDIAQAAAQLEGAKAELALLQHRIAQSELKAPTDAVIRSRLLERGDMASPQKPVFALALTDPKWIRAYVAEPQLGRIHPGMKASVATDSHPDQTIKGTIGYISSVAEFTPKSVQTEELRTSLVYEIRVLVDDSEDRLRLGMPATVRLILDEQAGDR